MCLLIKSKILIKIADFLKTCKFSDKDSDFDKCSTESIAGLFKNLAVGIKGLDRPSKIEPMLIPVMRLLTSTGPVSINASLTDCKVTGFGNAIVKEST